MEKRVKWRYGEYEGVAIIKSVNGIVNVTSEDHGYPVPVWALARLLMAAYPHFVREARRNHEERKQPWEIVTDVESQALAVNTYDADTKSVQTSKGRVYVAGDRVRCRDIAWVDLWAILVEISQTTPQVYGIEILEIKVNRETMREPGDYDELRWA